MNLISIKNMYNLVPILLALQIGCAETHPTYRTVSFDQDRSFYDMKLEELRDIQVNNASDQQFIVDHSIPFDQMTEMISNDQMLNIDMLYIENDMQLNLIPDLGNDMFINTLDMTMSTITDQYWGLSDFPWFFSIHSFEVQSNLNTAVHAFNKIIDLGGEGVRTDIFWREIEPTQGMIDNDQVEFYQEFFRLASEVGIKPLVIFSNPPEWAIQMYRSGNKDDFWIAYESYIRLATLMVRDHAEHYQIWNEPNHVIDIVDEEDDWELIYRGGVIIREFDPHAMLSVNAMANVVGWEDSVTRWIQLAGDYIDVIGVDHYPGTWACCDYTDWTPVETLIRRINDRNDIWYGKLGAVMETGFSSWAIAIADETSQAMWINEALSSLRRIIREANRTQEFKVIFANYYQLIDVDTNGLGQEAHFGILHSDLTHKIGYNSLRTQIDQF